MSIQSNTIEHWFLCENHPNSSSSCWSLLKSSSSSRSSDLFGLQQITPDLHLQKIHRARQSLTMTATVMYTARFSCCLAIAGNDVNQVLWSSRSVGPASPAGRAGPFAISGTGIPSLISQLNLLRLSLGAGFCWPIC